MLERILRAIRLDWTVFREIAEDPAATMQAAVIVVVVNLLASLGGAFAAKGNFALSFIVSWVLAVLVGWLGWAAVTYLVGSLLFKGRSSIVEMMRVLGYANAPKLLGLLSFIPCIGPFMSLIGWILALIAGVLAIREAMEFETLHAIITVVVSWVVVLIINLIILIPLTGMAIATAPLGG